MPEGYNYVALQPIEYDGVRAFNPGDPVPNSHIDQHGLEVGVQVAKEGSEEAEEVTSVFDPGEHSVKEVNDYLAATTDGAEVARVLDAERAGKNRSGILG